MAHRRRRLSRPRLGAATLAALACLVSGCSGGSPSPTPTASSSATGDPNAAGASPSSTAPVTLRFSVYGDQEQQDAYRAVARAYTRLRPNVTIKVETAASPSTARGRLDRDFAAGTPPDVFLTAASATPSLVQRQRVQPVDELLEKRGVQFADYYERLALEAFSADDALQCMPTDVSPYLVIYNRRLFSSVRLGEPGAEPVTPQTGWSWEQFAEAARQLSRGQVRGFYLPPTLTALTPLVRSAGADIVDDPAEPTTLQLADGGTRSALETVLGVARNPRLTLTTEELARDGAVDRFEDGRLGMMIGTRSLVPRLRASGVRFDVFPLPRLSRSVTVADVSGYCIAKSSQHVSDAADFLAFAAGRRGSALITRTGEIVPANLATRHSPAFEQRGRFPRNVDVFSAVMRRAQTMPDPLAWPQVVAATRPLVDRLFYAPVIDLDTLLPRIDALSAGLLAPPSESPSPPEVSGSPAS